MKIRLQDETLPTGTIVKVRILGLLGSLSYTSSGGSVPCSQDISWITSSASFSGQDGQEDQPCNSGSSLFAAQELEAFLEHVLWLHRQQFGLTLFLLPLQIQDFPLSRLFGVSLDQRGPNILETHLSMRQPDIQFTHTSMQSWHDLTILGTSNIKIWIILMLGHLQRCLLEDPPATHTKPLDTDVKFYVWDDRIQMQTKSGVETGFTFRAWKVGDH